MYHPFSRYNNQHINTAHREQKHGNGFSSFGPLPHDAAPFGKLPHDAEAYRTLPHDAAFNGNSQNGGFDHRNVFYSPPRLHRIGDQGSPSRSEHHTLTVKEVSRLFSDAGVPRIERSIVNWCQPNRQGFARLCLF
jgi:hypothetical protein